MIRAQMEDRLLEVGTIEETVEIEEVAMLPDAVESLI